MKKATRLSTLLIALALMTMMAMPLVAGDTVTGKVVAVSDGDTFVISHSGRRYVVQLAGIDAPELQQPFGQEARDFLASQLKKQKVEVEVLEQRKRTLVGKVTAGDRDMALVMVQEGLAWTADDAPPALIEAASKAKNSREGLWSAAAPTPPWSYRADRPSATGE